MEIGYRPEDVEDRRIYRTLSTTVVPRPIGWISTCNSDGEDNLAPFSFFTVSCVDPPMIQFTHGTRANGSLKDTAHNIHETEEFVHNVVTEETVEMMHQSSSTLPSDESEFDVYGIERASSEIVSPPRVAASPISFECTLQQTLELGTHTVFIGKIEFIHCEDSVTTATGELDIEKLDAVGRLTAGRYLLSDSVVGIDSVTDSDFPKSTTD